MDKSEFKRVAKVKYERVITYGEKRTDGKGHREGTAKLRCLHCGGIYNAGEYRPAVVTMKSEKLYDHKGKLLEENKLDEKPFNAEACPFNGCDGWVDSDGFPVKD